MATLTLRASKGSPLTNNEVDANFTNLNTDKYESGNNVSLGTISGTTVTVTSVATTGSLNVGGSRTSSTSATISAAGTTQSGATAMTTTYNVGLEILILNDTANNIKIYPNTSESIDGGAANAAVDLSPGTSLKLVGVSATKWNRLSPVLIYNSSGTRVN